MAKFVIGKTRTRAIYGDNMRPFLNKLPGHVERRASHIMPVNDPAWWEWGLPWTIIDAWAKWTIVHKYGAGFFYIKWIGACRFWQSDFTDAHGYLFTTKADAEMFERAKLERDLLRIRPATQVLTLHNLKEELRHVERKHTDIGAVVAERPCSTDDRG